MPGRQDWGYPAYFEHIVMPPDPTFVCPDLPIDVSTFMQGLDTDVSLGSMDLLDFVVDSNGDMNHEPPVGDHNEPKAPFTPDQEGEMQHGKERHPWCVYVLLELTEADHGQGYGSRLRSNRHLPIRARYPLTETLLIKLLLLPKRHISIYRSMIALIRKSATVYCNSSLVLPSPRSLFQLFQTPASLMCS